MPYTKTNWTDRIVQNPLTYSLEAQNNGTTKLIPAPGAITQQGTPITASRLNNLEQGVENAFNMSEDLLNVYKSGMDRNDLFTIVEWKRQNGTLYRKSVLSNPNANGYYQTQTLTWYDSTGTEVTYTERWSITYNSDDIITSEVRVYNA